MLRGRMSLQELGPYWGSQILGGLIAALLTIYVIDPPDFEATSFSGREIGAAFVAELLFTYALAYVVLNVATSKSHPDNQFYGLAIGFTVLTGAVAVGGVSGGAFNPAVTVGIMVMGLFSWSTIWIYLLAQAIAAVAAAYTFKFVNPEDA
jgi:aquaporin Z